jgi:hypothetical protein
MDDQIGVRDENLLLFVIRNFKIWLSSKHGRYHQSHPGNERDGFLGH